MKQHELSGSPLGQDSEYPEVYNPELLYSIPRAKYRSDLPLVECEIYGHDEWNAFEVSWLDERGKPKVAIAQFVVGADSSHIVESKSLKLYLNSLNQTAYSGVGEVQRIISTDLSAAFGGDVLVTLDLEFAQPATLTDSFICIDDIECEINRYSISPDYLAAQNDKPVSEKLVSHLFKSNCPATGQPDWASIFVDYTGPSISRAALLQYLASFRQHAGFHEHCAERIFKDIYQNCKPELLTVTCRFLRRGGIDINPARSTSENVTPAIRTTRQ